MTLIDGDTHDVDSNDLAFRFAASDALRKAVHEAGAVLLEPIMKVEVVTPDDYLGDVMADLLSRRCQIDKMSERGKLKVIDARAPLEKMFGYSTAVRSLSQGRASYSMEPLDTPPRPMRCWRAWRGGDVPWLDLGLRPGEMTDASTDLQ